MTDGECRCQHYITGLIDGELGWIRRLLAKRHLRSCPACMEIFRAGAPALSELPLEGGLSDFESRQVWRGIEASLAREAVPARSRLVTLRPILAPAATIALGLAAVAVVRFAIVEPEPQQAGDCIVEWVRSDYEEAVPFYYQPADGPTVIWVFEQSGGNGAEIANES